MNFREFDKVDAEFLKIIVDIVRVCDVASGCTPGLFFRLFRLYRVPGLGPGIKASPESVNLLESMLQ